jgi:hypothetical protein
VIRHLVLVAVNTSNIPFKYIKYQCGIFPPFFDYIWTLMAIHIHPFFCFLALIPELESEPSLGSRLCDCGVDFECRENDLIDVLTEDLRGYSAECLRHKICAHIVQD